MTQEIPASGESDQEGEPALIFVYGTLRKKASNHFRMAGAKYAGRAAVRGKLYRIDWYPGLVLHDGAGEISGELYRVGPELRAELDAFEGAEFERVRAKVVQLPEYIERKAWVWVYRGAVDEERRITRGDWVEVEYPRTAPLFVWVAWMPVLLGLPAILVTMEAQPTINQTVWSVMAFVFGGPIVMTVGGLLSLKRRERGEGCAATALFLGIVGLVLVGLLILMWIVE